MEPAAVAESQCVPERPAGSWEPPYHGCRAEAARIARYARTDVNISNTAGSTLAARLHDHLAPELIARLTTEGRLPPEVLAAECRRLRAELAAIATYIPSPVVRQ